MFGRDVAGKKTAVAAGNTDLALRGGKKYEKGKGEKREQTGAKEELPSGSVTSLWCKNTGDLSVIDRDDFWLWKIWSRIFFFHESLLDEIWVPLRRSFLQNS